MKSLKNNIRKILKTRLDISYVIREKELDREIMDKKLFIEIINQLRKIEERSDFLVEEIGMDLTAYENQFFNVIENLFKLCFNKEQIALIQTYLYQLAPDKEWDGTITIGVGNKEKTVAFKSPQDVWEVIKILQ